MTTDRSSTQSARRAHPVEYLKSDRKGPQPGVALCLSGGGYRAMLFHVGALWRLYEAGWLPKIDRISSVSGGSITAAVLGLGLLGGRAYHAHRMARLFHRHEEESLRKLGGMRHDTKAYYTFARQRIEDLERILLSELEDPGACRDAGWDTDSRREAAACEKTQDE